MNCRLLLNVFLLCAGVCATTASCSAAAQVASPPDLEQRMGAEEFRAAGLNKLSAAELARLQAWIQSQATTPAPAGADALERIREQAREEGRREVTEKHRGFFNFGSQDPIRSTLVGEFRGFAQGRSYTLANGQVWEQIEPARLEGVRRTDPAITIKPGMLNSWFLRIDGYNTAAKVRRVK